MITLSIIGLNPALQRPDWIKEGQMSCSDTFQLRGSILSNSILDTLSHDCVRVLFIDIQGGDHALQAVISSVPVMRFIFSLPEYQNQRASKGMDGSRNERYIFHLLHLRGGEA